MMFDETIRWPYTKLPLWACYVVFFLALPFTIAIATFWLAISTPIVILSDIRSSLIALKDEKRR